MPLFRKQYWFLILGIALLALFTGGGAVLQKDWQVAHRSHSVHLPSIDWVEYHARLFFAETKRTLFVSRKIGLPQVRLYVPERAQIALLSDIPVSTKKWRKAFLQTIDGALQPVKVRSRGDNPVNWIFGKKSWRVKARKKDVKDGVRTREYVVPQGLPWTEFVASLQAVRMGLLAPRARLVELFVNDESSGVYMERERLDESFLRNAGLMPVNLYKGEQFNLEAKERIDGSLFNNPGLWSKISVFNQKPESDFSDLAQFIDGLRRAEVSTSALQQFKDSAPIEIWSKFAAFQLVGGGFHNDWIHNLRVAIDPWTGYSHPIAYDVGVTGGPYEGPLEFSTHDVLRLLNMQPEFVLAKYREIYKWVSANGSITDFLEELKAVPVALRTSLERDIHILQEVYAYRLDRKFLDPDIAAQQFADDLSSLTVRANSLRERLSGRPSAEWQSSENRLSISIDGEIPLGGLTLELEELENVPTVFADLDGDRKFGARDVAIPSERVTGGLRLDAIFLADRVPAATRLRPYLNHRNVKVRETKFELIFSRRIDVREIRAANPLTGVNFVLPKGEAAGALPTRFNRPLVSRVESETPILWSGTVRIRENRILRDPVRIAAGTRIVVAPGASLMFRGKLEISGTEGEPVEIVAQVEDRPWGAISLVGPGTSGSSLKHVRISGGSGGELFGIRVIGMLSIHNTSDILLDNLHLSGNSDYDDMIHIVYGTNVRLVDCTLVKPKADGIDMDISKAIHAVGLKVSGAGNDAIDLMSTEALIEGSTLSISKDKGVSAGEKSTVLVVNTLVEKNAIGVESKDGSLLQMLHTTFDANAVNVSAYKKNWRYGAGGSVDIRKSIVMGKGVSYRIKKGSSLSIYDSAVGSELPTGKRIVSFPNNSIARDSDASGLDYGAGLSPMFSRLRTKPDPRIRGVTP